MSRNDADWVKTLPVLNFRATISEIFYSWELCSGMQHHQLERGADKDGPYITVNKLTITPTWASYKMENWQLAPGVWEKLQTFLDCMLPMLEPYNEEPTNGENPLG